MTYFKGRIGSSGQDHRQTAGSRNLTEYVTVIQNVSTKLGMINGRAVQNTDACGLRIGSVTAFGGVPARNGQNAEFGIFHCGLPRKLPEFLV